MDEFGFDRPELSGTLISMEFGPGGRIQQLWAGDPAISDESEEFQFICPAMPMGEELTEDYFPGTILLGARTDPDEPWIVGRNANARPLSESLDPNLVGFEYEFGFLDELRVTGHYSEIPGVVPQIGWHIEVVNQSRRSVEIGELGFPLALNNVFEGFPKTDSGIGDLYRDRVYSHTFIGGSASYLYAQRLNGRPPGLLIYPGEDTRWEFFNHVPGSLTTSMRWEGIPIVYAHSRGTIEREGWPEWFCGHTSIVLEPGDVRNYHMRFASADRFKTDNVHHVLAAVGRPAIRLYPAAVAPLGVGISVEVTGTTPARFFSDADTELETDADESGGYCMVQPTEPGPVRVSFEDTLDRESEVHLLVTEPIHELILKRADYIFSNQVVRDPGPFQHAIVPANTEDNVQILEPDFYLSPAGVEGSLADALFLAEKNTAFPEEKQIQVLKEYLSLFVEQKLFNVADGSIGALIPNPEGVAVHSGRPSIYPILFCLYESMARIAVQSTEDPLPYLRCAASVARGMIRHCNLLDSGGIPLMSMLWEAAERHPDDEVLATACEELFAQREAAMRPRSYPFFGDSLWSASGFEESYILAKDRQDFSLAERALRYAFAARNPAPSWWWYASDKRWTEEPDSPQNPAMADKGEMCLGPTTVANSLLLIRELDRDLSSMEELKVRLAFGGLIGIWALVRSDGAAGTGFCPDAASRQFGMSWTTGDVGLSLYQYLRGSASFVLYSRSSGVLTFGCTFEIENEGGQESYILKPWDGVNRHVYIRHLGLELEMKSGRLVEMRFECTKRVATLVVENPSEKDRVISVLLKGLWGNQFKVDDQDLTAGPEGLVIDSMVRASSTSRLEIKVKQ